MRFCVIMGSPRANGNTAELCKPFLERLQERGAETEYIVLNGMNINPCLGCYACQNVEGSYGCVQHDGMYDIVRAIQTADCIVLAAPIYSFYCPTQMKSVLDRHYGLNKFYGSAEGSLWKGKHVAVLATHGYDAEYGLTPFAMGVRRLCEHSDLVYDGEYSVRDEDDLASFRTEEAVKGAKEFADRLILLSNKNI